MTAAWLPAGTLTWSACDRLAGAAATHRDLLAVRRGNPLRDGRLWLPGRIDRDGNGTLILDADAVSSLAADSLRDRDGHITWEGGIPVLHVDRDRYQLEPIPAPTRAIQ